MNNFKFRRPGKKPQGRSIDGFVRNTSGFRGTDNIDFRRPLSYQPENPQLVGNFNQPDGYSAADQGQISANTDTKPVPQAKEQQKPRRRFFGRHKPVIAQRPKRSMLKKIGKAVGILFALVVLTYGLLFFKAYIKTHRVLKGGSNGAVALENQVDPSRLKGEGDGRVNILILGKGGPGYTAPDLTDTILVASIDPINHGASILSIPRDFYVSAVGNGRTKINAVYAGAKERVLNSGKQTTALKAQAEKAGFEAIEKTVAATIGIPIHYHIMIDFNGFKQAIDTVGGVDINAPSSLYELMSIDGRPYTLNVKPGQQHFDGFRALAYARSRYTSPRGDFDRAERQRLILIALKDKIFSAGTYANPIKISQLLDAFGDHIDTNMTVDEMLRLYDIGKAIPNGTVGSLGMVDPPHDLLTTAFIDELSVVLPKSGFGNYGPIQSFVRNELKDGYIKSENPSIMLLNGTSTAGQASVKADELKSYGYNVVAVADAPTKNYQKTVLVDLRAGSKKYTRRYLEQRFGVSATTKLPDTAINSGSADFVIILGTDSIK